MNGVGTPRIVGIIVLWYWSWPNVQLCSEQLRRRILNRPSRREEDEEKVVEGCLPISTLRSRRGKKNLNLTLSLNSHAVCMYTTFSLSIPVSKRAMQTRTSFSSQEVKGVHGFGRASITGCMHLTQCTCL